MRRLINSLVLSATAVIVCGCSPKATSPPPPTQKPPAFSALPVEITVTQRSTSPIPGSTLRLTIDDVTRGQVVASLADSSGLPVLAATSLKERESAIFLLDGDAYRITLRKLDNELVGDDFATFVISSRSDSSIAATETEATSSASAANPATKIENPTTKTLSEREKIDQLLAAIENDEAAIFIRNDAEYSAKDAAEHLRTKWAAAGDRIPTADEFIEQIASKSSITGEPYRVRLADGKVVMASDYLQEKLRAIEQHPTAK